MTTDTVAPTARPAWAVTAWADDNAIYIELPSIHGPCVLRYPFSESGLSKALHLMSSQHKKLNSPIYQAPGVNPAYKPQGGFSEQQRERAREVLRRLKIT